MNKGRENVIIKEVKKGEEIPYELLLLADPSKEIVDDYIRRGLCYLALINEEIVGVYVLIHTRPHTMEIVNIAVKEEKQGMGIGKRMIKDAQERAILLGIKTLEIGTGNSSLSQLALYQKSGFRIVGIDRDFFTRHYNEEIMENGIRCIDMIRLSIELDSI